MPIVLALPAAAAAIKVGGLALGSIIHGIFKHFGNDRYVGTAKPLLFINNEQSSRLIEDDSLEAPSSNAMVVYGSPSIAPSSSSRVLVNLGNHPLVNIYSQVESQIGKLASRMLGLDFRRRFLLMTVSLISVDLKKFVDWYLGRIVDTMQSAFSSFFADWKETICAFLVKSLSEGIVEKETVISISTWLQVRISSLISKPIFTLNEATHLLVKCEQQQVFKIVRQPFSVESPTKASHLDMLEVDYSVGSNIAVDCSKPRLSGIIAFLAAVKRILSMVFVRSLDGLLSTFRRGCDSVKVSALICVMIFFGVSMIGWNIPMVLVRGRFDDSQSDYEKNSLEIAALSSGIATPRLTSSFSHDIAHDAVFPSSSHLGNLISLPMHSHESPVDAEFNVDCHTLGLPSWLDGTLWNDSVSQSDTKGNTHSQIMWTAESSQFGISCASFAFSREQDDDEVISYLMTEEQHVPVQIESFDVHSVNVNMRRAGLMSWSDDEFSADSPAITLIVVQSNAKPEASVQIRTIEPTHLTRYEYDHHFVFTVIRGHSKMISFAVPTEQLELKEVEVYDEAAVVNLQHFSSFLADYPLQPSIEVVDISQILWYAAQSSHWAPICHGCEMNLLIFMVDLDEGASDYHRFEMEHSALAVAKKVDIYVGAINMGDGFSFIGIFQANSLVNVLVGYMAERERAPDLGRSSNRLVTATSTSERPQEPSSIKYPFRGALSIAEPSSGPSMRLILVFDHLMSQILYILPIGAVSKDLAQVRMSLSSYSESHVHFELRYSFEVIKAGISSRILESIYLAWMLLLLLWNNCDGLEDSAEAEIVSDSKTPADFIAIESETIFTHERIVFEEIRHIEKRKRLRSASKALHSDLGRHWKSPSKRRRRRSSRIRSKPKYFEPM